MTENVLGRSQGINGVQGSWPEALLGRGRRVCRYVRSGVTHSHSGCHTPDMQVCWLYTGLVEVVVVSLHPGGQVHT